MIVRTVGVVVSCLPPTHATRVRFPDSAIEVNLFVLHALWKLSAGSVNSGAGCCISVGVGIPSEKPQVALLVVVYEVTH